MIAYTFDIPIGHFRTASSYYKRVIKRLHENNKNKFIKGDNYFHREINKVCLKFFEINSEGESDKLIHAGISYEDPELWREQTDRLNQEIRDNWEKEKQQK